MKNKDDLISNIFLGLLLFFLFITLCLTTYGLLRVVQLQDLEIKEKQTLDKNNTVKVGEINC